MAALRPALVVVADLNFDFDTQACNRGRYVCASLRGIRFAPYNLPTSLFGHSRRVYSFSLAAIVANVIHNTFRQAVRRIIPIGLWRDGILGKIRMISAEMVEGHPFEFPDRLRLPIVGLIHGRQPSVR